MLAEPSVARPLSGPIRGLGLSASAASSLALVVGTALSTVVLMVVGELVPKNWAISSPLAVAKVVGPPQRLFSTAFKPLIGHLNNTANRTVYRMGLEPTEELGVRAQPPGAGWRWPATRPGKGRWRRTRRSCSSAPSTWRDSPPRT